MSPTFTMAPSHAEAPAGEPADLAATSAPGNLGTNGLALLMVGAVIVFLGPSIVLECAFGNRGTVFNDSPSSRPEITAYYQTFRGLEAGRMPWRDPQLADFGDRLIPPTMAIPQAIGTVFTAPFDERLHWGGNIAVTLAVIVLIWLLARILRVIAPGQAALQALAISMIVFGGLELYGFAALKKGPALITEVLSASRNFLYLNRLTSPSLTLPLFVGAMVLWAAGVRTERRRYFIAAGIVTGLLAYSYVYHWMVALATIGVSMLLEFWSGRRAVAGRLFSSLAIALVISLPFVVTCVVADHAPYGDDTLLRRGFVPARAPEFTVEIVICAVLIVLSMLLLSPGRERRCWLALFGGLWITRWSNVVLGKDIGLDHIQWHIMVPMLPLIGVALVDAIERRPFARGLRMEKWVAPLAYTVAVLAFVYGICFQIGSLRRYWPQFERPAEAVEMARYIRDELPKGVVVDKLSHETLRMAVYSRSFPYLSHAGPIPMSNRELEDRLLIHGRLYGLSEKEIVDNYISVFSLHLTPEPQNSQFAEGFRERIRAGESPDVHTYKMDYVLSWTQMDQPDLKLLHQVGDLRLYEFNNPPSGEEALNSVGAVVR